LLLTDAKEKRPLSCFCGDIVNVCRFFFIQRGQKGSCYFLGLASRPGSLLPAPLGGGGEFILVIFAKSRHTHNARTRRDIRFTKKRGVRTVNQWRNTFNIVTLWFRLKPKDDGAELRADFLCLGSEESEASEKTTRLYWCCNSRRVNMLQKSEIHLYSWTLCVRHSLGEEHIVCTVSYTHPPCAPRPDSTY